MRNPTIRVSTAALLLAASACGVPRPRTQYCPLATGVSTRDTVVLRATPSRVRLGRPVQVWVQLPHPRPDLKNLRLYIDGHPIAGIPGTPIGARCAVIDSAGKPPVAYQEVYEFVLTRGDSSRAAWGMLLGSPTSSENTVRVGVGPPAGPEFKTLADSARINFEVADPTVTGLVFITFLALVGLLAWAARTTSILRDPAPVGRQRPLANPYRDTPAPEKPPYSLARLVMATWTVIILGGFFAVWLITGDSSGILSAQALLLVGIVGVGTAASHFLTRRANELLTDAITEAQQNAMETRRAQSKAAAPVAAAAMRRSEEEVKRLAREAPQNRHFLLDLISDGNGPALYRVQHLMWNVAMVFVFVEGTYRTLAFPHFDGFVMTLAGISELMYIGLKANADPKPAKDGDSSIDRKLAKDKESETDPKAAKDGDSSTDPSSDDDRPGDDPVQGGNRPLGGGPAPEGGPTPDVDPASHAGSAGEDRSPP